MTLDAARRAGKRPRAGAIYLHTLRIEITSTLNRPDLPPTTTTTTTTTCVGWPRWWASRSLNRRERKRRARERENPQSRGRWARVERNGHALRYIAYKRTHSPGPPRSAVDRRRALRAFKPIEICATATLCDTLHGGDASRPRRAATTRERSARREFHGLARPRARRGRSECRNRCRILGCLVVPYTLALWERTGERAGGSLGLAESLYLAAANWPSINGRHD